MCLHRCVCSQVSAGTMTWRISSTCCIITIALRCCWGKKWNRWDFNHFCHLEKVNDVWCQILTWRVCAERQTEDGSVGLHQALSAVWQREAQHGGSVFQHVPWDRRKPRGRCQNTAEDHRIPAVGWEKIYYNMTRKKIFDSKQDNLQNFFFCNKFYASCVLWRAAITGDLKNALVKVLTLLKDAAESYSKVFLYIKL